MLVTIITPLYKVADFIERCAVSLFEQTYSQIEYVFVDDCSPDNSVQVLEEVVSRYPKRSGNVKIIRHHVNKGVAAARNSGIENATGDYVYYVDADDWLEKDAIEKMVLAAERNNADIVAVGWYLSLTKNERNMPMPNYTDAESALRAMLSGQMRWNLWLYMIRRSIYDNHGFRYIEGENVGEDMYMLIRLFAQSASIVFIKEPLYHYIRQNVNSITQMRPVDQLKRLFVNLAAAEEYLKTNFGDKFHKEIHFMKLNAKFPLLITEDITSYKEWNNYFKESDEYIASNINQSMRSRFIQQMAAKRQYWIVWLYNVVILNFIYGVIYR